jgi:hypothetical protein
VCTTSDHCAGGRCVGTPVTCADDGNPCTRDLCDPIAGCVHPFDACDDGNICTDDSCDPVNGCAHVFNNRPCDDGDGCSQTDQCRNGACVGAPAFFVDRLGSFGNGSELFSSAGANSSSSIVKLAKNVMVHDGDTISGDVVVLGNGASAWDVDGDKVKVAASAVVRHAMGTPLLPLTPTFCPLQDNPPACDPGSPITVAPNTLQGPIPAGVYGDVIVGTGGALALEPGNFTFCSIKTGKRAGVQITGPGQSIITIDGSMKIANFSTLYSYPAGVTPNPIVYVTGPLIKIGSGSHVTARIGAPAAILKMGKTTTFDGTFCTVKASAGQQDTLTCGGS